MKGTIKFSVGWEVEPESALRDVLGPADDAIDVAIKAAEEIDLYYYTAFFDTKTPRRNRSYTKRVQWLADVIRKHIPSATSQQAEIERLNKALDKQKAELAFRQGMVNGQNTGIERLKAELAAARQSTEQEQRAARAIRIMEERWWCFATNQQLSSTTYAAWRGNRLVVPPTETVWHPTITDAVLAAAEYVDRQGAAKKAEVSEEEAREAVASWWLSGHAPSAEHDAKIRQWLAQGKKGSA